MKVDEHVRHHHRANANFYVASQYSWSVHSLLGVDCWCLSADHCNNRGWTSRVVKHCILLRSAVQNES